MPPADKRGPPVVESKSTTEAADPILHALHHRVRQQEILAELGVGALQGPGFDQLLDDTARLTAEGLRTEFCKVLEYIPAENRLLVRAGVGWEPDVVGVVSIGADLASPAGFALKTGRPVISNHLQNEERFRTPEILVRHGIHRAMNVILQGDGQPFGVLEVDSRSEDEFVEHDLAFLQGAANILGMAIERERHERNLKAALERQQFLVKEMNHRVKNSLALVVGMLRLQAREISHPEVEQHLEDATLRVGAIARVHEQLYQSADVERFDVGRYIEAICKDLSASFAQCEIHVQAQTGIIISTDRAISSALIVNELVSNAAKHAYQGKGAGNVCRHHRRRQLFYRHSRRRRRTSGRLPIWQGKGARRPYGARAHRTIERVVGSRRAASRRRVRRYRAARAIDARGHCSESSSRRSSNCRRRSGMGSTTTASYIAFN
jgi:two-component sensor histidine kinase